MEGGFSLRNVLQFGPLAQLDGVVDPMRFQIVKRVSAGDHLVEEHAERVDIGLVVVDASLLSLTDVEDFRCDKALCSLQAFSPHRGQVRGNPEIGELAVAERVGTERPEQDVAGFQVTEDDTRAVEEMQGCCHLRCHSVDH